jgi:hypothetical protein
MTGEHPIDGQVILQAGAFASVPLKTLSGLVGRVQRHVESKRSAYEQQYERIEGETRHYYLTGERYWADVATAVGLTEREIDAVRRAHERQFRRDGRKLDRDAEFEAALEIRSPVAVAPR